MTSKAFLPIFSDLPDPRSHLNRRHTLAAIIVMNIMAVIAGAEGPKAIALWGKNHESVVNEAVQPPGGIPSHDTFGRVLMVLPPAAFQACFERWLRRVSPKHDDGEREIVAIDRKTLRGSHECVKLLAASERGHWGMENTLHLCLDVTFREDDCHVRDRIFAEQSPG